MFRLISFFGYDRSGVIFMIMVLCRTIQNLQFVRIAILPTYIILYTPIIYMYKEVLFWLTLY